MAKIITENQLNKIIDRFNTDLVEFEAAKNEFENQQPAVARYIEMLSFSLNDDRAGEILNTVPVVIWKAFHETKPNIAQVSDDFLKDNEKDFFKQNPGNSRVADADIMTVLEQIMKKSGQENVVEYIISEVIDNSDFDDENTYSSLFNALVLETTCLDKI